MDLTQHLKNFFFMKKEQESMMKEVKPTPTLDAMEDLGLDIGEFERFLNKYGDFIVWGTNYELSLKYGNLSTNDPFQLINAGGKTCEEFLGRIHHEIRVKKENNKLDNVGNHDL